MDIDRLVDLLDVSALDLDVRAILWSSSHPAEDIVLGVTAFRLRRCTVLSVSAASSPRNHLYRHQKVARSWRPFRLLGSSQHRGQIPSQVDPELALLRRQRSRRF